MTQCLVCDSHNVELTHQNEEPGFGLPSIRLCNVPVLVCHDCGESVMDLPRFNALSRQIAEALAEYRRTLTGREFAFLRVYLEATGVELARKLGVSNVTISRWENGNAPIDTTAKRLLQTLVLAQLGRHACINRNIGQEEESNLPPQDIDVQAFSREKTYTVQTAAKFGAHPEAANAEVHITMDMKTG